MARKPTTKRTAPINEYLVGCTLRVRAATQDAAKDRASVALLSLAGEEICGAWIDREARLFDPEPFAQIPGQLDIGGELDS